MNIKIELLVDIEKFASVIKEETDLDFKFKIEQNDENNYLLWIPPESINNVVYNFKYILANYNKFEKYFDINSLEFNYYDNVIVAMLTSQLNKARYDILKEYTLFLVDEFKKISEKFKIYDKIFIKMNTRIESYENNFNHINDAMIVFEHQLREGNIEHIKSNFTTIKNYLEEVKSDFSEEIILESDITYN